MSEPRQDDNARISRDPEKTATISPLTQSSTDARQVMTKRYRPVLLCLSGAQRGTIYKLEKKESVLGRSTDVDFVLDDIRASRRHVMITYENFDQQMAKPVCYIEDMSSRNGTELNGRKLEGRILLSDHDRIVVGKNVLGYYLRDESEILHQESLYETATRDKLTGLYNRHQTDLRLNEEVAFARRDKKPMSIVVVDIDRFKSINDTYGHATGDDALRHVAKIIEISSRPGDFVGRWGGEEFVLIMPKTDSAAAVDQAEITRKAIEDSPLVNTNLKIHITASLGVAVLGPEDKPENLFHRADKCLYEAKASGRNRVIFQELHEE